MRKIILFIGILLISIGVKAQSDPYEDHPAPTIEELQQKYSADTSARAVVLNEVGRAAIVNLNDGDQELEYKFYTRILILKQDGLDLATLKVMLYKSNEQYLETIRDIKASSFTLVKNEVKEVQLNSRTIIENKENKIFNSENFSIPGTVVGSIIDYTYTIHSPFFSEFHSWKFQSDIPKLKSIFTAVIPAIYTYNVSLKGLRKLDLQKAVLENKCLVFGNGGVADCSRITYGMYNIPAIHEEPFVSAMENYTSRIDFELVSRLVNGNFTHKITETWKDVDRYLKKSEEFGLELKRMTSFFKPMLDSLVIEKLSDSIRARRIYALLKQHLIWNELHSSYAVTSPRKLWADRKGSSGELNLALVAALRAAGLNADPLLLSCRQYGSPRKIFPVRTDFNNILASLELNGERYLLDITDPHMPFGLIAFENLSHEGRLFPANDSSRWVPIKIPNSSNVLTQYELRLGTDGSLKGKAIEYLSGYNALDERRRRRKYSTEDDYLDARTKGWQNSHITAYSQTGMSDPEDNLVNTFDLDLVNYHSTAGTEIRFSPFLSPTFRNNVFNSSERIYPLDLGRQIKETVQVRIEIPPGYKIASQPANLQVQLPEGGGYYLMTQSMEGNIYELSYRFVFLKDVYRAEDYSSLKEFISQILKTQQKFLVFQKGSDVKEN